MRLTLTTVSLFASLFVGSGCKRTPPPLPMEDAGPRSAPPTDHLAPGEIAEGPLKAFALPLPKDAQIVYQLQDTFEVESRLKPEDLSNFVLARVGESTKVVRGAYNTTFDDVKLPKDPTRHLRIIVRPATERGMVSAMTVRDVTPVPPEPKTTDEEAWRKAGRKPDGTPLDPKNMF